MIADIQGKSIHYIQEGQGQDVLILHGWGGSVQTVRPIVDFLKPHFCVTALDLPGFGESDLPEKAYDSYDYAHVVKCFILTLELFNPIVMGHSHGGRIGIILASDLELGIQKLVLIDSAGIVPKKSLGSQLKVFCFKKLKNMYMLMTPKERQQERMEAFYKRFGSEDYQQAQGVMRQTMVKVIHDDLKHLLPKIEAPTLLFWGEKDDATPLYMGQMMAEMIKDAGLVTVKNGGHYAYIDDFILFKVVIESFLNVSK